MTDTEFAATLEKLPPRGVRILRLTPEGIGALLSGGLKVLNVPADLEVVRAAYDVVTDGILLRGTSADWSIVPANEPAPYFDVLCERLTGDQSAPSDQRTITP